MGLGDFRSWQSDVWPRSILRKHENQPQSKYVWSNDISDKAIKARQVEDQAEAATWTTRKAELQALMQNRTGATAEEKAEYQVGLAREVARNERAAQGYVGALT